MSVRIRDVPHGDRPEAVTHVVGPRAFGPLTVAPGDRIEVRLVDATAGGFVWKVTELPLQLEARDRDEPRRPEPAVAGGTPGEGNPLAVAVRSFRAVAPGTGKLVLVLARPWEGYPVRQIRVQVTVQEPSEAGR